jgi:hypothetical protein
VPDQVRFEFRRNREVKFADAISKFDKEKLDKSFPQIFQAYEEDYRALREAIDSYEKAKGRILQRVERDYRLWNLKADGIIRDLFAKAGDEAVSEKTLEAARLRMMRGNPPGKDGSHGDAINWEHLLEVISDGEDLHLIAEDKDWREKGSDTLFSPFLAYEWKHAKKSEIRYCRRLSTFFKEKYSHITLATELEKEILIGELAKSGTFKMTRSVLNRLVKYSDFTESQLKEIAKAATTNNQVYWIGDDKDIRELVTQLLGGSLDFLDEDTMDKYNEYFTKQAEDAANEGNNEEEAEESSL